MSRNRKGIAYVDGVVAIECPLGHLLARVTEEPAADGGLTVAGGAWGPGWKSARPLDGPLSLRCPKCEGIGVRMDLRGSWDKVRALAAENGRDHSRRSFRYVLGE